ncbi:hypothetical protein IGI04_011175 [Brassica rapa subsp. trilocularis]|uniref:Uncharacterized protein n=1 Tax=Brassica rapa subsp. trilocularis TaxID=1813537 RepID=A0ABQ7N4G6_BRACM|nr:hypothetical protein IGI04_011175 [Brassica rapa subsp. trilocularis]
MSHTDTSLISKSRKNIKMASSKVSSMLLFLFLLVLVFHQMDKALGEQIQLSNRKLKETGHHQQLTAGQRRVLARFDHKRAADWIRKGAKAVCKIYCPPPPPQERFVYFNQRYCVLRRNCQETLCHKASVCVEESSSAASVPEMRLVNKKIARLGAQMIVLERSFMGATMAFARRQVGVFLYSASGRFSSRNEYSTVASKLEKSPAVSDQMSLIKQLRQRTSAPIKDVKASLVECNWDIEAAQKDLRKR